MSRPVHLFSPYYAPGMDDAALEVLRSGQISAGPYVDRFRAAFGELVGSPHLVTTNDMSSAIQLALRLADVRPGDEVLTAAFACMSTNAPIATSGATPVWVDVDPATGLMDLHDLEAALSPRTRAAVVYHLAGYPAPIESIAATCRRRGIALIEDCDNALLARVGERIVGSFGDFAIYSFYPNRQINASEGGALVCRNAGDAARAAKLRRFGIDPACFRDALGEIDPACDVPEIGWAASLNNLCSAIALTQVQTVADRIEMARRNARQLMDGLQDSALSVVQPAAGELPSFWAVLTRTQRRDELLADLKQRGVHCSKLHHRTDTYTGFAAQHRELPGTKAFMDTALALPCGWWLTSADIADLIDRVRSALRVLGIKPMSGSVT